MSYLVLARKWRPQTFADLVGQEQISRALTNALTSGRIAHAFLFTGARGVGKTSAARILAKALNCEQGTSPEPCNVCSACMEITAGNAVDVLEIDGASNTGVDDVRELRDTIRYLPARGRYKIVIIDEVHMLSTNAFNALLKTLEEPPRTSNSSSPPPSRTSSPSPSSPAASGTTSSGFRSRRSWSGSNISSGTRISASPRSP